MSPELPVKRDSIDNLRYVPETVGTADFQSDIVAMPAKLCSLPPLSTIATRVLALSDDPDGDLKQLASVVEGDPAFAAEVLFLANSPLFGFPARLQALHHAMAILGLDRIKSLAMTVAMRAFVGTGDPMVPLCWRHSVACAVIAESLSRPFALPADQAYSAALLHDIGRLGLLKAYPQQMHSVLSGQYETSYDVLEAERAAAQVDHEAAGAWLVQNWSLPKPFFEVCGHHHEAVHADDSALLKLVKVSCLLADSIGYSVVQCKSTAPCHDLLAMIPNGARSVSLPSEEELRDQVKARLASLVQ